MSSIDQVSEPLRGVVSEPLYQLKAEFFKTLGHPARIRILELLTERDRTVGELLPEVGLESSNLSQQLAVLRRAGVVGGPRAGTAGSYSMASPAGSGILAVGPAVVSPLPCVQDASHCTLR